MEGAGKDESVETAVYKALEKRYLRREWEEQSTGEKALRYLSDASTATLDMAYNGTAGVSTTLFNTLYDAGTYLVGATTNASYRGSAILFGGDSTTAWELRSEHSDFLQKSERIQRLRAEQKCDRCGEPLEYEEVTHHEKNGVQYAKVYCPSCEHDSTRIVSRPAGPMAVVKTGDEDFFVM